MKNNKACTPCTVHSAADWITAQEAAALLGISTAAIRAYAERGVIRRAVYNKRLHRYYKPDVEAAARLCIVSPSGKMDNIGWAADIEKAMKKDDGG